jgi:endo-1,4-beta-D-glucanase Y
MFEVYPDTEEREKDPDWIREQTTLGRVLLTRDKLRHAGEKSAVAQHAARMFLVAGSAKSGAEQARYIENNIDRIIQRCRKTGPFIYRIDAGGIERVFP